VPVILANGSNPSRTSQSESEHRPNGTGFFGRWFVTNSILAAILSLCWLVLRTGTKPSRLAYPCQQAALSTALLAIGAPLAALMVTARRHIATGLRSPIGLMALAAVVLSGMGVTGYFVAASGYDGPMIDPPRDYRAELFHVSNCPEEPEVDRFEGVDELMRLMGRNGLKIHRSTNVGSLSGLDGLIAADDVILLKINYQWGQRGGSNVDVLRGLIRVIVDHPDGFNGEVVVCENSQFASAQNLDRSENNAQDHGLSPRDVINHFAGLGHEVSGYIWTGIRYTQVNEYSDGDMTDGYVVYPYDSQLQGRISYPKFQTDAGTMVSVRDGIWDADSQTYDRDRLKIINLPVLKSHSATYGATAAVKNIMGLVTIELGTSSHSSTRYGLMGAVMAEVRPPDLNILDAIWINANPYTGPSNSYSNATRRDELVASVDPVALDMWAVTNILVPAFLDNGFNPPWPNPDATPDDPNSDFRVYLDRSMSYLLAAGFDSTNDLDSMDVYSAGMLFENGFDSGNTSAWSAVSP
jgi:uncharacterized protein (DUF362 family)